MEVRQHVGPALTRAPSGRIAHPGLDRGTPPSIGAAVAIGPAANVATIAVRNKPTRCMSAHGGQSVISVADTARSEKLLSNRKR